jgi:hypothetical protein
MFSAELGEGGVSGEGVYISPRKGGWFGGGYYWEDCGLIWIKLGIKLCIERWVKEGLQGLRA